MTQTDIIAMMHECARRENIAARAMWYEREPISSGRCAPGKTRAPRATVDGNADIVAKAVAANPGCNRDDLMRLSGLSEGQFKKAYPVARNRGHIKVLRMADKSAAYYPGGEA
jgi:hypothetical protein